VVFLHCSTCRATTRILDEVLLGESAAITDGVQTFLAVHGECPVQVLEPTGRAAASGPWHDPLIERRFEVSGCEGVAVVIGVRESIEEPLAWRVEPGPLAERSTIELDREAFEDAIDRALYPLHLPMRAVSAWASSICEMLASVTSDDVEPIADDPQSPAITRAILPADLRERVAARACNVGFDGETMLRLQRILTDPEFPAVCIVRSTSP
jgi:hypothetical protein